MINHYEINKEYIDEFGRVSGIFTYYKKAGEKSHDIVDMFRKIYGTRHVGHAGALDPFAEGLLILLVGKATKQSISFLNMDKEYFATVLFGISTDSMDIDGKVLEVKSQKISKEMVDKALKSFTLKYLQRVPVLSSVKVKGEKLRELARKHKSFKLVIENGDTVVQFYNDDLLVKTVTLPVKEVTIKNIVANELKKIKAKNLPENILGQLSKIDLDFYTIDINVECSKGTYIRQLAFDIGEKLGIPAMLINLYRTRVGKISSFSYLSRYFPER